MLKTGRKCFQSQKCVWNFQIQHESENQIRLKLQSLCFIYLQNISFFRKNFADNKKTLNEAGLYRKFGLLESNLQYSPVSFNVILFSQNELEKITKWQRAHDLISETFAYNLFFSACYHSDRLFSYDINYFYIDK